MLRNTNQMTSAELQPNCINLACMCFRESLSAVVVQGSTMENIVKRCAQRSSNADLGDNPKRQAAEKTTELNNLTISPVKATGPE